MKHISVLYLLRMRLRACAQYTSREPYTYVDSYSERIRIIFRMTIRVIDPYVLLLFVENSL